MARRSAYTWSACRLYGPELKSEEGVWHQLKGVRWWHVCCFNLSAARSAEPLVGGGARVRAPTPPRGGA
jgi:hypothetical protein